MRKRDYKSYSILDEEISKEEMANNAMPKADIQTVAKEVLKSEPKISEDKQASKALVVQELSEAHELKEKEKVLKQEKMDKSAHEKETIQDEDGTKESKKKINLIKQAKRRIIEAQNKKQRAGAERKEVEGVVGGETKESTKGESSIGNYYIGAKENKKNEADTSEVDKELDFPAYKKYYQQKERSRWFKGIMGLAKLIILIMLLPLIGIIGFGVLTVVGCVLAVIIGAVGVGVVILEAICFMSTQISASLIGLGIATSVTCIAFGGIIFILFVMFIRWIIGVFKKYRKSQMKINRREDR